MNFKLCTNNKAFPYMIIDDFYSPTEEDLVWKDLEKLKKDLLPDNQPIGYGIATEFGKPMGRMKRVYLDDKFLDRREDSNILQVYKKITSQEVRDNYKKTTAAYRQWEITNNDESIVSYYDDGDCYNSHFDKFMHTVLIWFYKKPKRFTGGNLTFPESNQKVECLHNRLLIFPSYYLHEIDKVELEEEYRNKELGRYCITHFYTKK